MARPKSNRRRVRPWPAELHFPHETQDAILHNRRAHFFERFLHVVPNARTSLIDEILPHYGTLYQVWETAERPISELRDAVVSQVADSDHGAPAAEIRVLGAALGGWATHFHLGSTWAVDFALRLCNLWHVNPNLRPYWDYIGRSHKRLGPDVQPFSFNFRGWDGDAFDRYERIIRKEFERQLQDYLKPCRDAAVDMVSSPVDVEVTRDFDALAMRLGLFLDYREIGARQGNENEEESSVRRRVMRAAELIDHPVAKASPGRPRAKKANKTAR